MMSFQRYHPLTILFEVAGFIKSTAIFAFLLFVVKFGSTSVLIQIGQWGFLAVTALTLITLVMKWFANRYATDDQGFHIKSGIFSKIERTVYYEKIQNVQRQTSFLHKLFRMTSITFETGAGSADASVEFAVLTKEEADRLEVLVDGTTAERASAETANETVPGVRIPDRVIHFTPTRGDLIKATFTSLSFLFLIAIAGSLFSKLDAVFNVEERVEGWLLAVLTSGWVIAVATILLIIVSFAAGFIRTFITYGKYEIASDDSRIYISKGVLNESAFSILKRRVQGVEITQSFMKRLLGLAEVKLISAGGLGEGEQEISILYPFLPVNRANSIISELLPDYKVSSELKRLPRKSLAVRLVRPYWFWLVVTVILAFIKPEPFGFQAAWWTASLGLLLVLVLSRIADYWNTKYAVTDGLIQVREGALETTTYLSRRDKIIEVSVKRTKFQQWTGLATIGFINRAQSVRHETLKDVPIDDAEQFFVWYAKRSAEIQVE
ncbi:MULTISPECIES: PH domain-containing protein [unclassified Sporosarcina]|uniref:PH domain-containing protein n=1 Tax=unclassified Sporosarcina TaxID=2647733 RepID=UPI00203DB796|nr:MULTISPECIES: PH domain-containing protein [unclassified Sporosarcina]GKV66970.1 membrane protein [Sporosarcina sp. NCCP-2331]GLB57273.1 membrane protein [Sporosarcina sp. NCCP-2378]